MHDFMPTYIGFISLKFELVFLLFWVLFPSKVLTTLLLDMFTGLLALKSQMTRKNWQEQPKQWEYG